MLKKPYLRHGYEVSDVPEGNGQADEGEDHALPAAALHIDMAKHLTVLPASVPPNQSQKRHVLAMYIICCFGTEYLQWRISDGGTCTGITCTVWASTSASAGMTSSVAPFSAAPFCRCCMSFLEELPPAYKCEHDHMQKRASPKAAM